MSKNVVVVGAKIVEACGGVEFKVTIVLILIVYGGVNGIVLNKGYDITQSWQY
jgi:hypothetical protein